MKLSKENVTLHDESVVPTSQFSLVLFGLFISFKFVFKIIFS